MENPWIEHYVKWVFARVICLPAIVMPYKVRITYITWLSVVFHFPFVVFGRIARFLLDELSVEAIGRREAILGNLGKSNKFQFSSSALKNKKVAVLFSGGTDSTCCAALCAQKFSQVHLLTFWEEATKKSPIPKKNVNRLKKYFKKTGFIHIVFSVDKLVKHLWYENYLRRLAQYRLLALSTCGFSTLSWHIRAIVYCLENDIHVVCDGLTRELMHFPGHMDVVVLQIKDLYKKFGIIYESPVREWPVPPDQQFIDKLIVNRHDSNYILGDENPILGKTTGQYLYNLGFFPTPNVKGSNLDFSMQHDCYPFALYNVMAFWGFLSVEPYEVFCTQIAKIMGEKIKYVEGLLDESRHNSKSLLNTMMA